MEAEADLLTLRNSAFFSLLVRIPGIEDVKRTSGHSRLTLSVRLLHHYTTYLLPLGATFLSRLMPSAIPPALEHICNSFILTVFPRPFFHSLCVLYSYNTKAAFRFRRHSIIPWFSPFHNNGKIHYSSPSFRYRQYACLCLNLREGGSRVNPTLHRWQLLLGSRRDRS